MWTLHYNRFAKKDEMFPNWDLRGFILTSNFAAATTYYVDLWEDFLSGLCVYATFCPFIQKSIWTALLEQNRSFPETKDVLHWGHIVHPNTWCEIVCLWFQHFWHLKGYQCIDAWKSTVCGHFVSWNIGACEQNYVFFKSLWCNVSLLCIHIAARLDLARWGAHNHYSFGFAQLCLSGKNFWVSVTCLGKKICISYAHRVNMKVAVWHKVIICSPFLWRGGKKNVGHSSLACATFVVYPKARRLIHPQQAKS